MSSRLPARLLAQSLQSTRPSATPRVNNSKLRLLEDSTAPLLLQAEAEEEEVEEA